MAKKQVLRAVAVFVILTNAATAESLRQDEPARQFRREREVLPSTAFTLQNDVALVLKHPLTL